MTQSKYETCDIIENMAMCPPAVRTVIVVARPVVDPDTEEVTVEHAIYPVLAIRTFMRHTYRALLGSRDRARGISHEDMVSRGWHPDEPETVTEAVYVHEDYGLIGSLSDDVEMSHNGRDIRIVLCPWPADQDEVRLAELVRRARSFVAHKIGSAPAAGA